MKHRNRYDELGSFTVRWIQQRKHQLLRRPEFNDSGRNDLEQELAADLMRRRSRFDPGRLDWKAFVTLVTKRRVAT